PRWSVLFEEYATAGTRLLLYLPISVDGSGAFSDRVGHTVVLADVQEVDSVRGALSEDAEIMAVLTPVPEKGNVEVQPIATPPVSRRQPSTAGTRAEPGDFDRIRIPKDRAREALIADLRKRQRSALMAPPAAPTVPATEEVDVVASKPAAPRASMGFPPPRIGIHEPTFATRVRPKKKKRARMLIPLLVLLVVSSAAAGWHYWGNQWWANRRITETANRSAGAAAPRTTRANPAAQTPATPIPPAKPEGRPMPYSVAIAGYQVLDQANLMLEHLRTNASSLSFYVAPAVVHGTLFYRVFAGPLPDSATAAAVRDTLMARRLKTISVPSDVVSAPLAFLLGTFVRRADAETKAREAAAKGVPTYIVPIGSATGMQYNLYAGAYAGPGDADFMREILKQASLPDTLVERTGSIRS
ncbi:MAG TPA: SPOR domain-containing protein, partial [Planctomycetota bacterium]|nr:SPOR domain-containing protein [Planctomycetota bacterium]